MGLLLTSGLASAQQIGGTVSDTTGGVLPGVTVEARSPAIIELSVGDIAETITVSGASPVVDIQNVEQRAVMDREIIDSIPSGKSISSYGLLVPGMTGAQAFGSSLAQDAGGLSAQIMQRMSIHGGNSEDQMVNINGMDVAEPHTRCPDGLPVSERQRGTQRYSGEPS